MNIEPGDYAAFERALRRPATSSAEYYGACEGKYNSETDFAKHYVERTDTPTWLYAFIDFEAVAAGLFLDSFAFDEESGTVFTVQ